MGQILESSLKYCQRSVILSASLQNSHKPCICLHTMHRRALDAQGAGLACHHCLAVGATIAPGRQTRRTPILSLACHHHTRVSAGAVPEWSAQHAETTTTKRSSSGRKQKLNFLTFSVFHHTQAAAMVCASCLMSQPHKQKKRP